MESNTLSKLRDIRRLVREGSLNRLRGLLSEAHFSQLQEKLLHKSQQRVSIVSSLKHSSQTGLGDVSNKQPHEQVNRVKTA